MSNQPPPHMIFNEQWYDDPPQIPGYYWFYGDPNMGQMGGHYSGTIEPDHKLYLVRIQKISNGLMAVADGQFIPLKKWDIRSRSYGIIGKWAQVKIPDTESLPSCYE